MANGWAPEGAVQEQIDNSLQDAVTRARSQLPQTTESLTECEHCGECIPEGRRQALPGVRLCVQCQTEADQQQTFSHYNRRGSKDSQLR